MGTAKSVKRGYGTQAGERVPGATSTASLLTGVAYCTSGGSYEVRLPEIPRKLSRGSLALPWWVSFGEQKWVSFAERQGICPQKPELRCFHHKSPYAYQFFIARKSLQSLATVRMTGFSVRH